MKTAKQNQRVAFTQAVIRRTHDQARTANMRGTILEIVDGRLARVDTHGTYPNEDGESVRLIPLANLTPILDNGIIFGD